MVKLYPHYSILHCTVRWRPTSIVPAGEAESPGDGFAYYLWGVALRRSGGSFEGFNLGTAVDEDLMEVKCRGKGWKKLDSSGTWGNIQTYPNHCRCPSHSGGFGRNFR